MFYTNLFFFDVFTLSQGDVFYRPPESETLSVYVGESTARTVRHYVCLLTATLSVLATIKKSTFNHQWRRSITYNNTQSKKKKKTNNCHLPSVAAVYRAGPEGGNQNNEYTKYGTTCAHAREYIYRFMLFTYWKKIKYRRFRVGPTPTAESFDSSN